MPPRLARPSAESSEGLRTRTTYFAKLTGWTIKHCRAAVLHRGPLRASSVRFRNPSLVRMWSTCTSTVRTERYS